MIFLHLEASPKDEVSNSVTVGFIAQIIVCFLLDDMCFYWYHRVLHR